MRRPKTAFDQPDGGPILEPAMRDSPYNKGHFAYGAGPGHLSGAGSSATVVRVGGRALGAGFAIVGCGISGTLFGPKRFTDLRHTGRCDRPASRTRVPNGMAGGVT